MSDPPLSSPLLLQRDDSALLIVDVQEKLVPAIANGHLVWNIRRLIDAAQLFQIPISVTEQYPQGLGETVPELAARLGELPRLTKSAFSAASCPGLLERFSETGIHKLVIAGIEAHVCILQTALDCICEGYQVYVVADAVGSRCTYDAEIALRRMESSGAYLTTTEATLFEWCRTSGTDEFKATSGLVKQSPPGPR